MQEFQDTSFAHENTNCSLWKVIKKTGNTWARSNEERAEKFSNHLSDTFTPYNINNANSKCHTDVDARNTSISTNKHYTIPSTIAQEIRIIIKHQEST